MKELTFFTSNATKLAHARYIAEKFPVRIKSFRQRTYHANYAEPRLPSRAALLDASYRSALEQCAKAGLSTDNPFILEDTSVRIDALSSPDAEVPGLEIKYWMKGQTFAALDTILKFHGNNRSVTVRSDVVLHVPTSMKKVWNVEADYIVFVGQQHGYVSNEETMYDANLVYPWLDNLSFNRWFIPAGHSVPFGALSIHEADLVDFRRKSFEQLFNFLQNRHYISFEHRQLEFGFDKKPNLILAGYTCAGKTIASQHLARKFGYLHVEASDFMYLSYYYRHGYQGEISIGDFAENGLKQKPEIAAEKVAEYIAGNLNLPVVVSGFRAPAEIAFLARALESTGKSFRVVFVEAAEKARFKRLEARMRPSDVVSIDHFKGRDEQQRRMGLDHIAEQSTVRKIANNATLAEYLELIDTIVGNEELDNIIVSSALEALAGVKEIRLEEAILIALLGAWAGDETRPFFTTTQIARMINSTFPGAAPKHKDNVSRYFNQDFYAYYEISDTSARKMRKYRLSNTGYGMSIAALRQCSKDVLVR